MNTKPQSKDRRNRPRSLAVATAMLLVGLTTAATLDVAAASSRSGNRAPAPRAATNQGVSHINVVNQNKTLPNAKTEKICLPHQCHGGGY